MNTATNLPPLKTLEEIEEEAYIAACEEVGPNAIDFEAVRERIEVKLINEYYPDLMEGK